MDDFYRRLPKIASFSEVFLLENYRPVPGSWWFAMTDVVGSTKAIEAGRYKDVNSAGSLGAMAISNLFGHMDFPFIFGGDGMTCLVPGEAAEAVRAILAGTGPVVRNAFDLDLRLAMIPVQDVLKAGKSLALARWAVSSHYTQAIVEGDGMDYAEALMKAAGSPYLVVSDVNVSAPDFTGYSCRWQDFPSQKEETIALIVKFRLRSKEYLQKFIQVLDQLFGAEEEYHPLTVRASRPRFTTYELASETAVITGRKKGPVAFFYRQIVRAQIVATLFFTRFGIPFRVGKKNVGDAKKDNVASSDYRKYDNTLKMVVAVTRRDREALEKFLKAQRDQKSIFYGVHISNRAMLTCLVHTGTGEEVHFVDAADGGYARAALQMKQQIKSDLETKRQFHEFQRDTLDQ